MHRCPYPQCKNSKPSRSQDCGQHKKDNAVTHVIRTSEEHVIGKTIVATPEISSPGLQAMCSYTKGCKLKLYLDSKTGLCPQHACPFPGCGREKMSVQQDCGNHDITDDVEDKEGLGYFPVTPGEDYAPMDPDPTPEQPPLKENISKSEPLDWEFELFGWLSDQVKDPNW